MLDHQSEQYVKLNAGILFGSALASHMSLCMLQFLGNILTLSGQKLGSFFYF